MAVRASTQRKRWVWLAPAEAIHEEADSKNTLPRDEMEKAGLQGPSADGVLAGGWLSVHDEGTLAKVWDIHEIH